MVWTMLKLIIKIVVMFILSAGVFSEAGIFTALFTLITLVFLDKHGIALFIEQQKSTKLAKALLGVSEGFKIVNQQFIKIDNDFVKFVFKDRG